MTLEKTLLASLGACALVACAPKSAEPSPAEQPAAEPANEAPAAEEPAVEEPTTAAPAEDLCGAAGYQSLLGTNAAAVSLPADLPHRILGPNDAATMDYRPDRLNIMTDESGVIIEVKCG